MIEKHYPDHGIVGEEFGNVRGESPWQWVLDPIDGTRAFIAGKPTFATLIALAKDGVPVLGLIDQPISKERWVGVARRNALSQQRHAGPSMNNYGQPQALDRAAIWPPPPRWIISNPQEGAFERLKNCVRCKSSTLGGDAYAYGMLANGRLDIVVDAGLKPYDFCALPPVIEGAGGIITDWQGNPLTLNSDGRVMAAPPTSNCIHDRRLHSCKQQFKLTTSLFQPLAETFPVFSDNRHRLAPARIRYRSIAVKR